jgi:hypothetical protein
VGARMGLAAGAAGSAVDPVEEPSPGGSETVPPEHPTSTAPNTYKASIRRLTTEGEHSDIGGACISQPLPARCGGTPRLGGSVPPNNGATLEATKSTRAAGTLTYMHSTVHLRFEGNRCHTTFAVPY